MTKDGGPAYPVAWRCRKGADGMSLRDWFAGLALAAYLALPGDHDGDMGDTARMEPNQAAEWAYEHADAMLKERETK